MKHIVLKKKRECKFMKDVDSALNLTLNLGKPTQSYPLTFSQKIKIKKYVSKHNS